MKTMFRFIIRYARIFTLLIIILPLVAGVAAYRAMPKEGSPEVVVPIALVMTQYIGASPLEVESLVTNPLEDSLSELSEIEEMRSFSAESVSIIVTEFDIDADMEQMLQKVRDKVDEARKLLPDDVEEPEIEEINFSDIPIMVVSIKGDMEPLKLRRLAEDTADELRLMPEVLDTEVAGGLNREIYIYLDPGSLNRFGLTILDVIRALQSSDISIPGGPVTISNRKFMLRTFTEIKQVEEYARIPLLERGDRVVFLGDVADIVDGHDEDVSYSRVDGEPSVTIAVKKRPGSNILETSLKVREALEEMEKEFPNGVSAVVTADQGKFIKQGFETMNNSAVTGLIIVIIVLCFAMGLRNSVITSFSIPLSLLITFILLKVFGLTNNDMVRFSLVLCIGLLVDNAIIVVESAYHHYQLGKDRLTAIIDGVSEVALPVVSATLTTIAAFLPMLLMTGVTGKFMSFMPKTVSIALFSSLLVALIANPLILSRFMNRAIRDGKVVSPEEDLKYLKKLYGRIIIWSLNHRVFIITILTLGMFSVAGLFALKVVKIEMFPEADFDYIYITIETAPGTDVEVTRDIALQLEHIIISNVPETVRLVSSIGFKGQSAFEFSIGGAESSYAEITLELLDNKEYRRPSHKDIQQRIRPLLDAIPGADIRYRPIEWGPPTGSPINVKIFGHDLQTLNRISDDIEDILSGIPGATEIQDDFQNAPPELKIHVDRARAAALGIPLIAVSQTLRGATAGIKIKDFRDERDVSKKYDLTVRFSPESRTGVELLDRIKVRSATGSLVPLGSFATVTQGAGINQLRHIDRRRVVRMTAQNEDRSAVEITEELQEKLKEYPLPPGYSISYAGDIMETEESFASLRLAYIVAFILILTILVAQFNSFFQPFAIMAALPLSVMGAIVGLVVTGNNFSIMSFIGLVGLSGIVVNDSIVLVDRINQTRRAGMNMYDSVLDAGKHRLRPIISTTLTTIGGLITLTMTDKLWEGLGVVIIFGIGFATFLTLIVVPVSYTIFDAFGYYIISALRGARWKDHPAGRCFSFTRRRWARLQALIILLVQAGVIYSVLRFTHVTGWFISQYQSIDVQAPTFLKTIIEAVVFYLTFLLEAGGFTMALLLPLWFGLLYLMCLRNCEGYYVAVTPEKVIVTSPVEKLVVEAGEILELERSRLTGHITIRTAMRRIVIGSIKEGRPPAVNNSLVKWLLRPAPGKAEIRSALNALYAALNEMKAKKEVEGPIT